MRKLILLAFLFITSCTHRIVFIYEGSDATKSSTDFKNQTIHTNEQSQPVAQSVPNIPDVVIEQDLSTGENKNDDQKFNFGSFFEDYKPSPNS